MAASSKLPLSADDLAMWKGNIERAEQVTKTVSKWWEENLKKYAPDQSGDPKTYGDTLNTNRDFTLVERKKADLFFQRPDVSAIPSPLFDGQEATVSTETDLLNAKLGLNGINVTQMVQQVIFDVLCPAGTGWSIMGYESATVDTPTVDPMTGAPSTVPVPVYEDCFWRWFSPKCALIPDTFRSTIWDDAPWLGMRFEMPIRQAKRKGWVPDDFRGSAANADLYFDHGLAKSSTDAVARGVLIYYKSALYRDDRVHPQHFTLLVLMDGVEEPADHKDSPYQTLDAQGKLTPDSLIGNPIHPQTIRTLTDASQVPSDCTISRPLVNELNKFREQMIESRDANLSQFQYNVDTLPPDALAKAIRGRTGAFVGLPAEAFVGEGAIKEIPHGTYPRENFTFNDYIDNDLARTHALDSNQQAVQSAHGSTATEAQIQQGNANAVLSFQRGQVLDWYIRGVTKFACLLQRYLTVEQAAAIVGAQRAQAWDGWRKTIPVGLAFTALPDSALRTDLATERKRAMDEYTFFANDPYINRVALLEHLLPKLHYPVAVLQTQPPAKGPEPARPSFAFTGADLNPMMPQFPIVMAILQQAGITIPQPAVTEAQQTALTVAAAQPMPGHAPSATPPAGQQPHGGKVAPMESLSKHANDLTGGMQGTGAPAMLGQPGGHLQ
jgi:hypothetical protein